MARLYNVTISLIVYDPDVPGSDREYLHENISRYKTLEEANHILDEAVKRSIEDLKTEEVDYDLGTDMILNDRKRDIYQKHTRKAERVVVIVHGNKIYIWEIWKAPYCTTDFH
jgi:hypothetical protein